jgi:glycosyltransferase involved in cell wall biosynthesis
MLYLDPYHGGSHAAVATGYAARSRHHITLLPLPTAGGWRWRMRGAAVSLARLAQAQNNVPDLIFTTDMLDLATFKALYLSQRNAIARQERASPPMVVYFHENQLTYPLPPGRTRDLSFAWINYTSALVADAMLFNSEFHRRSFLDALPGLLQRYHDYRELQTIDIIAAKSQVLAPGIDLARHDASAAKDETPCRNTQANQSRVTHHQAPIILWNSRWDYDKQPAIFFAALEALAARGAEFRLIVAGEHVDPNDPAFVAARERWAQRILHWGYAADPALYSRLLHQADIVVSTAIQEFFGIGIIEALYCGCIPILPRRLTYPDLLPVEHHADCLYETFDELVERIEAALARCAELRQRNWRGIAAPYDWSLLGAQFDAVLKQIHCQACS